MRTGLETFDEFVAHHAETALEGSALRPLSAAVDPATTAKLDPAQLRIRMPHLVIWGMDDQALLPAARATLSDYCDDLTVREIAGADHWMVHQRTDEGIGRLQALLEV